MTRGPLPLKAIATAKDIAVKRGTVLDPAMMKEAHIDFTIYGKACTYHIRIRRIRTHVTGPEEIGEMFAEDIRLLRIIPLTPVATCEIWTLSPWGSMQFFRINDDAIVEIQRDGLPVQFKEPAKKKPAKEPGPAGKAVATNSKKVQDPVGTGIPATEPAMAGATAGPEKTPVTTGTSAPTGSVRKHRKRKSSVPADAKPEEAGPGSAGLSGTARPDAAPTGQPSQTMSPAATTTVSEGEHPDTAPPPTEPAGDHARLPAVARG